MQVEARQKRDGALRIEPFVTDHPLVDGEQPEQAPIGIDTDRREVMDRPVRTLRPHEAVEMPMLGLALLRRVAVIIPLRARLGIEHIA